MRKTTILAGLALMVGILLASAPAALAEFTAVEKASEGKTSSSALSLEAGGATIQCKPAAEPTGDGTWIIESKAKEHLEKGPDLILKAKTWGECIAEAKGIESKEAKVTSSECELEVEEPHAETRGLADVVSTCVFKIEVKKESICEVKIESKENQERKEATMSHSGEKNENTIFGLALEKINTTASGTACTTAEIKSTAAGKLFDGVEAKNVSGGMTTGVFNLTFAGGGAYMSPVKSTRTVGIVYTGSMEPVILGNGPLTAMETTGNFVTPAPEKFFSLTGRTLVECQNFQFGPLNRACNLAIESVKVPTARQGIIYLTVRVVFNGAEATVRMFI
jgi:hypothetical protein